MSDGVTVEFKVHVRRAAKGKIELVEGLAPPRSATTGRVPRVARLMALALKIDGLVRDGLIRDYADAARLGHVTRARMSQIIGLLNLAPDIIEAILHLPLTAKGRDPIAESDLRSLATECSWLRQRAAWTGLSASDRRRG